MNVESAAYNKVYRAAWRAANHDHIVSHRTTNGTVYHRRWKMKKMGLVGELTDGPYRCPICKKREGVVMDHDHGTGKFRGMLCVGCNGALGTIGEDNLRDALAYVGKE